MSDPSLTLTLTGEDAADPALNAQLRNVAAERFDAYAADPSHGVPLDEASRRLLEPG